MQQTKKQTVAAAVRAKTLYTLKAYCELKGLSYPSLVKGYVSQSAARQLKRDGIDLSSLKAVA